MYRKKDGLSPGAVKIDTQDENQRARLPPDGDARKELVNEV